MSSAPNIREIARRVGCSPSTVSRVLANRADAGAVKISAATRGKIMEICAELNYTPSIHAARLFSRRSQVVGFLPPRDLEWEDDNLMRSFVGVCHQLNEYDYRCLPLRNTERFFAEKEYLNIFRRNEIDALIIWGEITDAPYLYELAAAKMPFMLLGNRVGSFPAVVSNQRSGMETLVRHCQTRGAKKMVYLDLTGGDSCEQRRSGFCASAGESGTVLPGGLSVQDGYAAAEAALKLHPDAIVAGNDKLAVGVTHYLRQHGIRIPEDILLTGGDNIELAEYCAVPLSTFDQRATDCAKRCVDILIRHLEHQEPLVSEMLDIRVIFRQSTGD